MLKIYQSIRAFKLVTEIEVDGKFRTIEFSGGARQPRKRNGIFSTVSPKLQRAIEGSGGFNRSFKLVKSVQSSEPVKEEEVIPAKVDDFPDVGDLDSKDYATSKERVDYSKVEKAKDARDILFALDKTLTYNDIRSKDKINEQAKRLKISFPLLS